MKKNNLTFLLLVFLSAVTSSWAQKNSYKLPEDLADEKIIFLEFESIQNDVNMPYAQRKRNSHRNTVSVDANKYSKLGVTYYPFGYTISNRSEYFNLTSAGYKYVLENDMMNSYNNGEHIDAGRNKLFSSPMYIMDLGTGERFELFNVTQDEIYDYEGIMKDFVKLVRKAYDK